MFFGARSIGLRPQRLRAAATNGVPVVEPLLGAALCDDGVLRLGCGDKSLDLLSLDSLVEIPAAKMCGFTPGSGDAGKECGGMACRGFGFDLCRDAAGKIEFARARCDAFPAPALAVARLRECVLQCMKPGKRGFKGEAMLLFFEFANSKQAAKNAGDGHRLHLRRKLGKAAHSLGKRRALQRVLGKKSAQ